MAIVHNEEVRLEARREEWEDREYYAELEKKRQIHELRVLKQKLKYTTRWKSIARIVGNICNIVPKCLAVISIVFLQAIGRPVPQELYTFINA